MRHTILLSAVALFVLLFTSLCCLATEPKIIIFSAAPWDTEQLLNQNQKPLMRYIEQQLNVKTKFIVNRNYAELTRQLKSSDVHISFMSAVSYVEVRKLIPQLALLAANGRQNPLTGKRRTFYKSYIITLKNSSLSTLQSLKK
jgi:ABC-type phosphate/phosphonate transport system substrate-binding protein